MQTVMIGAMGGNMRGSVAMSSNDRGNGWGVWQWVGSVAMSSNDRGNGW